MPDTNPDAVKPLSDDEVAEIEARANAATPRYCVDWEKGRHALLRDSGWRSASEEQPRTIATFDREDGYLDLLFCAEARTDIPALCATVRALRVENKKLKDRLAEQRTQNRHLWEANKEIVSTNTALREQLAQSRAENERLASQLKQWQEEKDTKAGYL